MTTAEQTLAQHPRWVAWAAVDGTGEPYVYPNGAAGREPLKPQAKPHKIPVNAVTGGPAKVDDPGTLADHATAMGAMRKWNLAGVGFVLGDPYAGVDLDNCRNPETGEIEPRAQEIIDELNSYTEVSPSRTGLKTYVLGTIPLGGNQFAFGGSGGKVEMFDHNRYFAFTGEHLAGTPATIEKRQGELDRLHARMMATRNNGKPKSTPAAPRPVSMDDAALIDKAKAARNGAKFSRLWSGQWKDDYPSQSEADLALVCELAFWTGRDLGRMDAMFRSSGLYRDKWEREDYRERTLTKAVERTSDTYSGGDSARGGDHPASTDAPTTTTTAPPNKVLTVFRRWLHLPDPGIIHTVLGTVAANLLPGDPAWLLCVGPPGSGKTEVTQSLMRLPSIHSAATLTEAALLSGTPAKDRNKEARGGLLRIIGAFGFLILKDFTSILAMNRDARGAMLAALREIYDGSWTRHVGVDGGRTLHWMGKLALIGGCTPTIDSHHAVMATMGERFLLYRLPEVNSEEQAERALSHGGREKQMREELAAAVSAFFSGLTIPATVPHLDTQDRDWLITLSTLVVKCRSAVERDSYSREIELIPDPESPARLALSLAQLLAGMKLIGLDREHYRRLINKVGMDCVPNLRRRVLECLANEAGPMITSDVAVRLEYPTTTARRALEDLVCHRVVRRLGKQREKDADVWQLTEWAEMRLKGLFPKCQ